jgi:hypothetical protein
MVIPTKNTPQKKNISKESLGLLICHETDRAQRSFALTELTRQTDGSQASKVGAGGVGNSTNITNYLLPERQRCRKLKSWFVYRSYLGQLSQCFEVFFFQRGYDGERIGA